MKYNICGTSKWLPGYINVDIDPKADLVCDITKPLPIESGSATHIFSCATLEHLTLKEGFRLLEEFYRVLKGGGELTLAVPDLVKIITNYTIGRVDFKLMNQYLYGAQTDPYDFHKSVYTFKVLKTILQQIGFIKIMEVKYDLPVHLDYMMLKLICKKTYD